MTKEFFNYLAEWMPDAPMQCDGCTRQIEIGKATSKEDRFFCSERCAEIATAPMIHPQPKRIPGVNFVDGWDV